MRAIRSRDTKPELIVRKALRAMGMTGYRVHRKDLPGRPDIAFIGRKVAIFVHGCFWHRHDGCRQSSMPSTNTDFWAQKFARNVQRDIAACGELKELGWKVHVIWECESRSEEDVVKLLAHMLGDTSGA